MAKVVVKSKIKKVKRKFPVELVAPEYLGSKKLGSSKVTDLNSMIGKTAKISMMYITGSVKNQNIRLVFRVFEVNSGVANTKVVSYSQVPYYLGRFVKVGSDLIEDSFVVKSKDGINMRIKPFIVTKSIVSSMVATSIRLKARELLTKEVGNRTADDFMHAVILSKLQNMFRAEIKKISPIKTFEFKKVIFE